MSNSACCVYEFGPFRLETAIPRLLRHEQALVLPIAVLRMLITLVESHRELMTYDELSRRLAPALCIDIKQLTKHAATLRKALGRDENGDPYLEVIQRQGCRFSAAVLLTSEANTLALFGDSAATAQSTQPQSAQGNRSWQANRRNPVRPGMQIGRFQVLSLLGAGGMGKVFLARDVQLDRRLALKLLPGRYTRNPEWLRRFLREARVISTLNHPNIITIHDIGESDGHHYIATEHIEGETLRALISPGQLKSVQALDIAIQLAGALDVAHNAGIVHRDLKPENVIVRPDGIVKLLDFGLAKPLNNEVLGRMADTLPGTVLGTTRYMSPEQARGQSVDARSDVFSLGVVLYEMLTGAVPFAGANAADVLAAILERHPPPLSHALEAPAELERIVGKSLRKDRDQRYQTSRDLQLDLKALLQELELRSRPEQVWSNLSAPSPLLSNHGSAGASAVVSRHHGAPALEAEFGIPEVHYARSGDVNIAYQVIGDAPLDLVFVMGWVSHLEYFWTESSFARFLRRLATFARVILFDKRGTGLSDRVPLEQLPTLEQRMDDVRAVMEAVGSERAVLCGVSEGGPMCSLFAATHPERTTALVMIGSYARRLQGQGYPWGPSVADRDRFLEEIRSHWGGPVGLEERAPSVAKDPAFRQWWSAYLRHGASPGAAVALTRMNTEIDIRHVLPSVRVPTLVLHRSGDACLKVQEGRYLAEHVPGAKFVELPGVDHLPFVGEQDEILDEIEEFLTGVRHASGIDRVLATVLAVRLSEEASTHRECESPAQRHQLFFAKEVELFKGKLIQIDSHRVLASFDGPARAIRAALAICTAAQRLQIPLRAGLHTGECDLIGGQMSGLAVDIARQIAKMSAMQEVLVSGTVKDLVAGSGIRFVERGTHELPGRLGEWRLFAVTT
jgi:serine/threonine protein kinase/pimeloyl-ACP methyl ester carboxylesterase/DNA-binding winged helix-turn-helix (wHTH) protein